MTLAGERIAAGPWTATVLPCIDVETYSEAGFVWNGKKWDAAPGSPSTKRGLMVVGTRNYVQHPSFELLCLTYDLKDGRGPIEWHQGDPPPLPLFLHVESGGLFAAWNAGFEFQVWNEHCVPKLGWPPLRPEQMRCDMAKARAWGLPGALAGVGEVLRLKHQKHADGARMVRKFTMPRNPTKDDPRRRIRPSEDPEGAQFYAYNRGDVEAESEANERIPDLSETEQRVWEVDQIINRRGVAVDLAAVDACIEIVEQATRKYGTEFRALAGCDVSEGARTLEVLHGLGVHLNDLQDETVAAALTRELPATAKRILEIRRMLASASVKKLYSLKLQAAMDGRVYDLYGYHAARTARWGGYGPQPQNLYSGTLKASEIERAIACIKCGILELVEYEYGDALECINNCMRAMFIAAPGYDLVCSDYHSIEAVVLAALAGEEWRLVVFRTHGMIYEKTASDLTGVPLEEFVLYRQRTGKHHLMRRLGKIGELAAGYGSWIGGWKEFGADEFFPDEYSLKQAILKWRAASPNIVEFWGGQTRRIGWEARPETFGLEGACVEAILHPGEAFAHRDISFQVFDDVLYMRLPSGRCLSYHRPRLQKSERPYAQSWEYQISFEGENNNPKKGPVGWIRMFLYGGLLAENATQAVARDVQAHAIVALERAGYRPVMHTHDEIIGEIRVDGFGSVEEFEEIMARLPPWAKGWPIHAAGGWRGKFYRKGD